MFQDQFKGTEGEWKDTLPKYNNGAIEILGNNKRVGWAILYDEFGSKINKPEEVKANAKLFAASKKIAFELDNLLDALCGEQEAEDEIEKAFGKMIAHRIFMAKNALKQAI